MPRSRHWWTGASLVVLIAGLLGACQIWYIRLALVVMLVLITFALGEDH